MDDYGNAVAVAVAKLDREKIIEAYGVVPENTNFGIKATVVRNLLEANNIQVSKPNTTKHNPTISPYRTHIVRVTIVIGKSIIVYYIRICILVYQYQQLLQCYSVILLSCTYRS